MKDNSNYTDGRESNFELLRIVAMFLVLIVHADFSALGVPTHNDIIIHPILSWSRYVIQHLALVCVNVYILISGYFGIKLKVKSILNFVFMLLFWRVTIVCTYIGGVSLGIIQNQYSNIKLLQFCIPGYGDWFVAAYVGLLLLSPILNACIERRSVYQLCLFVIVYCGFQIIFDWLIPVCHAFAKGYSTLSFIGLYIIGTVIRKSQKDIIGIKMSVLLYVLIAVVIATVGEGLERYYADNEYLDGFMVRSFMGYNNLFVLAASVFLFLAFKQMTFRNKYINYIAVSTFAVYLFHMHPLIMKPYLNVCRSIYNNNEPLPYILIISCFIIAVFCTAIIFDLLRRWLWHNIWEQCRKY